MNSTLLNSFASASGLAIISVTCSNPSTEFTSEPILPFNAGCVADIKTTVTPK